MDKGLIRIKELEKQIRELEIKKTQKRDEIISTNEKICDLEDQIIGIERENDELEFKKKMTMEAPKRRKQAKKAQIISYLILYIMVCLVGSLAIGVGMGSIIYVLGSLATTTVLCTIMAGIILPIEFRKINRKYPVFSLSVLEKQITLNKEKIETLSSVDLKKLEEEIEDKTEIRDFIEKEINQLQQQINTISCMRFNVIEEFCKGNLILEKKLDDAYDKSKVKEKVK